MKKFLILSIAFVLFCGISNAQTLKFGHINTGELMQVMPESDSLKKKMDAYIKDMREIIDELNVEYNKKFNEFSEKQSTWSDAVKKAKEKDLIEMQRRLQEQQQTAEAGYEEEYRKLLAPIQEKVRSTITKIAKANGLIYVFDVTGLLYFNETQSTDLMPLVKKEMGINK